jgi:hypothetical protein
VAKKSPGAALIKTAGAAALSLLCVVAFLWDVVLVRLMIAVQMNDFGRFYYSARAFLDGKDMYAPSPATLWRAGRLAAPQQLLNLNPPHFHLLVLPLALLPPNTAVIGWMLASIFALALSLLIIAREIEFASTATRAMIVALFVLACSASQAVFITGQLAFLMLLPVTLCWRDARRGRWNSAGAWLGVLLSIKLFFLIFVPYLMVGRRWRALAAMTVTISACFMAGLMVFHSGAYSSWIGGLRQSSDWAWLGMNASTLGIFERILTATPTFQPIAVVPGLVRAWLVVGGVIALATLTVTFADNTANAVDRSFALLLVCAQLVSPVGWVYYLCLAAGPLAALVLIPDGFRASTHRRYPQIAGFVALAGLLTPITSPYYYQPSGWATLTIGSVYFWATLALWLAMVMSFVLRRRSVEYQPS